MNDNSDPTYGEQFESALKCETLAEAEYWMEREVKRYVESYGQTPTEAMRVIKINLGYMAGYYSTATAEKIERMFNAPHPIFGSVHNGER